MTRLYIVSSPCLFNLYTEYLMCTAGLDESQVRINIAGRRVMEIKAKTNKWNLIKDFPGGSDGKDSACNAVDGVPSLGRADPWRREWPPTPVFFPGEFHGQRSLEGYSP